MIWPAAYTDNDRVHFVNLSNVTNSRDFWGLLHRVYTEHPLSGSASIIDFRRSPTFVFDDLARQCKARAVAYFAVHENCDVAPVYPLNAALLRPGLIAVFVDFLYLPPQQSLFAGKIAKVWS